MPSGHILYDQLPSRHTIFPRLPFIRFHLFFSLILASAVLAGPDGNGISEFEKVTLGGLPQSIYIRGENKSNPILLLLHGGPGFPEMPLFRTHNSELEKHYVVVNWDQRGAGLSYSPDVPPETMKIDRFVEDTHELIGHLKKRFGQQKVFLLGHSWGSVIGVKAAKKYPGDVIAYIGVNQVANGMENERLSLDYTLRRARAEKNEKAIGELTKMQGRFPRRDISVLEDLVVQRAWLNHFGGTFHRFKGYPELFGTVTAKENELYDEKSFAAGELFSMKSLWVEVLGLDLMKEAPKLDVPVYFLLGRHDHNTPTVLAEKYFKALKAPTKELVLFEESGHFIPFEEPAKFNRLMTEKIRKLANR